MRIMNLFKKVSLVCVLAAATMLVASCQSKEEKVISHLEDICELVESKDFEMDDFDKVSKEYDELAKEVEGCDFTSEQLEEVSKLQGRIIAGFAKQTFSGAGTFLNDMMNAGKGMVEGLADGLGEDE